MLAVNSLRFSAYGCGKSASHGARRALVIEDEQDIANLVGLHLHDLDLQVTKCGTGALGLKLALGERWHLIVLDLSLPGVDGLEICRRLRSLNTHTPVLMLTARTTEQERVLGLDSGADDYLTKPFSVLELTARARAILRRVELFKETAPGSVGVLEIGDLEIDIERREARRANVRLDLTGREFDLLVHFVRNRGKVYSRAQLLDQVWGLTRDAYEHTVSSHINRLRAKLEPDPRAPRYLLTAWGVGYRFSEE